MINPNEPAFPCQPCDMAGMPQVEASTGLTIRAHFAAMALQGVLANEERIGRICDRADQSASTLDQVLARWSVKAADALIAELNRPVTK